MQGLLRSFARQLLTKLTPGVQPDHAEALAVTLATCIYQQEGTVKQVEAEVMYQVAG